MNFFEAIVLGIVEGLTEFLPVSSTGHLILTSHLLGLERSEFLKAFEVIIQSGAMLAVVGEYRGFFVSRIVGFFNPKGYQERSDVWVLLMAFIPAVIVGLVFGKLIKQYLFGPLPVVLALAIGGIAMIVIERRNKIHSQKLSAPASVSAESLTMPNIRQACFIGLFQCLAFWPGMSRAMTTLLGGRFVGLNAASAARFSFLLAVPTLFSATAYDLIKLKDSLNTSDLEILILGMLVSCGVAWVVIRLFLNFLKRNSLEIFGWYRLAAAGVYALFFL